MPFDDSEPFVGLKAQDYFTTSRSARQSGAEVCLEAFGYLSMSELLSR